MIRLRPSGADEVLIKRVRDWYEPGPGVFISPQTLFSPALLFTGSTTGTWYDPSDMTTLFQDAAGTTPVTAVEQPVGLMLDKSKGLVLGPELVTNGDFAGVANGTDVTTLPGWAAYGTPAFRDVQGERLRIQATAGGQGASLTLSTTVGKRYIVKAIVAGDLGLSGVFSDYTGDVSTLSGSVNFQFVATATSSVIFFRAANNSAGTTYYDNISVRELPGNHAFNPSGNSANFSVLSARYNLLTKTEQFDDAAWAKLGCSVSPDSGIAPDGTQTADTVTFTAASQELRQLVTPPASNVLCSIYVKGTAGQTVKWDFAGNGQSFTLTGNWQLIQITQASSGSAVFLSLNTYGGATARVLQIWGADLRVSNDALNQPAYQRVNTATDYDTAGFKPYLKFNGTNQWLQTNSIDFSYGDKMFVCAGVRKLSDAATTVCAELSADWTANAGAFVLHAPSLAGDGNFYSGSRGTTAASSAQASISTGNAAPKTAVLASAHDIAGDLTTLRVNSVAATSATGDKGTGNYGNYPLYIGARAGSSLWFNGRLHQLIVAGKQASDSEIGQTEAFTNQKTGAY